MRLYHGTNGRWLGSILANGLRPRGRNSARSNWKHVAHQSNSACVYLTDSYAPYFAFNAARGNSPECAVVEVETDLLPNQDLLLPDEDFLEQAGRRHDDVPGDMSQRTIVYRKRQHEWYGSDAWKLSMQHLGTCCYAGSIPREVITRAVVWPHVPNARLMLVWDPTITMINQKFCGDRYRALTARLFAGEFTDLASIDRSAPPDVVLPPIEGWRLIENGVAP